MNLWSTLSWWSVSGTLCLFPFVFIRGNTERVSPRSAPSSFVRVLNVRVSSHFGPRLLFLFSFLIFGFWWLSAQENRCPSLSVQPFELCVGGSKLSIKCFCWGREKIWYSGETKVICSRKFNCLSRASLRFRLASPPNQFQMKAQVQMRFNFESVVPPILCEILYRFDASVFIWKCCYDSDVLPHMLRGVWVSQ